MAETKTFHIGDILSITDGRLVSPRHIDGVYDILNWLTNDNLFTHQLPRASQEAAPILREWFPDLAQLQVPETVQGSAERVREWVDKQVQVYGETREVPQLETVQHTPIDPLSELAMMRPDAEVLVIEPQKDK